MITHDLGVVAGSCDKVLVMYAGRTMEYGKINEIFYKPSHPPIPKVCLKLSLA